MSRATNSEFMFMSVQSGGLLDGVTATGDKGAKNNWYHPPILL